MVKFLFIIIDFFRYLLRLRRYKRKSVEVGVSRRGWVTSRLNFRLKDYFFRYLLRLWRYKRKSVEVSVFEGGGLFWAQISDGRDVAHQPLLASENWSYCPFVWYQNICSALFGFVIKHACDRQTDGRTNRQNNAALYSVAARKVKCTLPLGSVSTCLPSCWHIANVIVGDQWFMRQCSQLLPHYVFNWSTVAKLSILIYATRSAANTT